MIFLKGNERLGFLKILGTIQKLLLVSIICFNN